jgi:enoyl-CoA hydratase/carnithine racemase
MRYMPRMENRVELTEVLYEVADGIATITLNRPEQRNPLGATTLRELREAILAARDAADVRALIVTGAGDKAFSAGADLSSVHAEATEVDKHLGRAEFVELFTTMERVGKPIVACVNGHALAGGFGLAMACDLVVAAETATFGTPEINVGLWPMMIMAIIGRNLPRKRAVQLYMTGERIDARTAQEWGIVNRVVPQAEVRDAAREMAGQLAGKSPLIMRLGRDALYRIDGMDFESALRYLQSQLTVVTLSEDSKEGVRAFLEKREPDFQGR